VSFTIDDDTPVNFDPEDTIVSNVSGSSITGDLDVANHVGADGLAAVSPAIFTGIVSGVTQATGIINGASAELTSAGEDIILYLSADGSQVFGKIDGGATTVFTATLNAAGSDYTFQLNGTIDNGAGIVFDDFTGTTAGNEKWFGVINPDINGAPADPTDEDLLLTPINVDSINTNNTTIGVGNQSVTAGRGADAGCIGKSSNGNSAVTGATTTGAVAHWRIAWPTPTRHAKGNIRRNCAGPSDLYDGILCGTIQRIGWPAEPHRLRLPFDVPLRPVRRTKALAGGSWRERSPPAVDCIDWAVHRLASQHPCAWCRFDACVAGNAAASKNCAPCSARPKAASSSKPTHKRNWLTLRQQST